MQLAPQGERIKKLDKEGEEDFATPVGMADDDAAFESSTLTR